MQFLFKIFKKVFHLSPITEKEKSDKQRAYRKVEVFLYTTNNKDT